MNKMDSRKQSGFVVLLGMLILVLGTSVWLGTWGGVVSNTLAINVNNVDIMQLHRVKDKMLAYAVLHPNIYSDAIDIPGPGYFPCPDKNGDGISDTNCGTNVDGTDELFILGRVPYKMSSRNFTFLDSLRNNALFWYAVDTRLVNSSGIYATYTTQRFSPVNNTLDSKVVDSSGNNVAPFTLDGKDKIVMVLFYAGARLNGQARPSALAINYLEQPNIVAGSSVAFSSVATGGIDFNDYVITITRSEWESAVLASVSLDINPADQVPDNCLLIKPTDRSWFNECLYSGTNIPPFTCTPIALLVNENMAGQGWRNIICP